MSLKLKGLWSMYHIGVIAELDSHGLLSMNFGPLLFGVLGRSRLDLVVLNLLSRLLLLWMKGLASARQTLKDWSIHDLKLFVRPMLPRISSVSPQVLKPSLSKSGCLRLLSAMVSLATHPTCLVLSCC